MTTPADLSKLRINRDAPSAPERRALTRSLILFLVALIVVAATVAMMRARAFAFRVTPQLLLAGLTFAVVMGVVGGFFPARRASKLPVIQALR
jgi:ABC-type antimicrobial peptide transport system permease subunit